MRKKYARKDELAVWNNLTEEQQQRLLETGAMWNKRSQQYVVAGVPVELEDSP